MPDDVALPGRSRGPGGGPPSATRPAPRSAAPLPGQWARRRPIGDTGVEVSAVGLGGGPIGNLFAPVSDATAGSLLAAAFERGIRYFDTAPVYGMGLAEARLGRALAHWPRHAVVVSTKVGRLLRADAPRDPELFRDGEPYFKDTPDLNPVWDFSYAGTRRSLDQSLGRLGLAGVEIAFLHEPPDRYLGEAVTDGYRALDDIRRDGAIRAIGVGWDRVDVLARLVAELDLDCVLEAGRYTLLDQSALDGLLPTCVRRGVAVVAGGVFNSGILADPGAAYEYGPAPSEVRQRVQAMTEICDRWSVPLKAAALQFPLGHPAVVSVVVGMRTPDELTENLRLIDVPVPGALWRDLQRAGLLPGRVPVPHP
jgi:D-threo-aldose 1-dehydrogenase